MRTCAIDRPLRDRSRPLTLHDDRPEGPVDSPAQFEQSQVGGARPELGDPQLDVARLRAEQPRSSSTTMTRSKSSSSSMGWAARSIRLRCYAPGTSLGRVATSNLYDRRVTPAAHACVVPAELVRTDCDDGGVGRGLVRSSGGSPLGCDATVGQQSPRRRVEARVSRST